MLDYGLEIGLCLLRSSIPVAQLNAVERIAQQGDGLIVGFERHRKDMAILTAVGKEKAPGYTRYMMMPWCSPTIAVCG